jgi:hypothetical protein
VKLLSMLADQAQIDPQQKVHALGLNWTHIHSPAPTMAVIVIAEVSLDETPTAFSVMVELVDSNGEPVNVPSPPKGEPQPFKATAVGTAGKADPDHPWAPTRIPFVVQVGAGLQLTPGDYKFVIAASRAGGETQHDELRFVVRKAGE